MTGCINHSLRFGWIAGRPMPSRQATPCDETGFHQPNQTAEALAVFRGEIPEREETHAMFEDPALAFNQESPDARGQLLE